ncbi:MAG TPA: sugar transferase [Gaiellaceae bacterium]|nr:sugar transferase [Gaiellaceae bacterium]
MTEAIIAHEDVGGPATLEYAATLELPQALEVEWPRREPWPHLELAVRIALAGLIGCFTAVILATLANIWGFSLVGLTVAITTIWFLSLRRSAHLARELETGPIVATVGGTTLGLAVISLLNFWVLDLLITTEELLVMAGCVFLIAAVFYLAAARILDPARRVVLLDPDDHARELAYELKDTRNREFECIGVVEDYVNGVSSNGVPSLGDTSDLVEIVRRHRTDVVVCASDTRAETAERLLAAGMTSVHVLDTIEFQECALHRVDSQSATPSWFASVLDLEHQNYSTGAKRMLDVVVASIALVLTSPLLAVVPLLIRASGRGPVLYRQIRVGEGGKLFEILKFRTMVPDAEAGAAVWASENDPRTTPVGRVLRKTRIDELPQLWNVLRGEMSIVGPRPERPEFLDVLGEHVPFWSRRDLLKPGITGWAQVQYAYTADVSGAATKLSYDLYYLKHRSLALDALILSKTFGVVLLRRGGR